MRPVRSILPALLMSLVLVLSGTGMAAARAAPSPTGQMILCTGSGPVAVFVDENGQPTAPPHLCADCIQAGVDGLPVEAPEMVQASGPAIISGTRNGFGPASRRPDRTAVRGPPRIVLNT